MSPDCDQAPANPKFTQLNNLASKTNGGKVLFATDDFFAVAENLLEDSEPVFDPTTYNEFGKVMDGWETRRKRITGHDWCIIKLGAPCRIEGILADTAHFTGNYVPKISVQGATLTDKEEALIPKRTSRIGQACSVKDLEQMKALNSENWTEIVQMTKLLPGFSNTRLNYIATPNITKSFTHLRLNYYPDGGLARFKVFGVVKVNYKQIQDKLVDVMSVLNGTVCVGYSDAHFGHPCNLIKKSKSESMADGWETARRLDRPAVREIDNGGTLVVTGSEHAIFRLGIRAKIEKIIIDTNHFKGNFPDHVLIEGVDVNNIDSVTDWTKVSSKYKLSPHKEHVIDEQGVLNNGPFTHIKVTIFPDGGLSRVRIFGYPC